MKDIMLDELNDVLLQNNDLVIGYSDQQQREHLLLTEKGDVKQFPDAGVGTLKFLESEDPGALLREISIQFSADGMRLKQVRFNETGKILVNAPYEIS
jgi:hypothetical protein